MEMRTPQDDSWSTWVASAYTGSRSVSSHPYFCPDFEKSEPGPEAIRELILTAVSSYVPVIRQDEVMEGNTILGKGGAATVFSGSWRGRLVALKRFNIYMPSNPAALLTDDPRFLRRVREAKTEMITMTSQYLQSQGNICRLLAIYFSATGEESGFSPEPVLVMEQADMSLSYCIENAIFDTLGDRISILRDLANGICAFHDVGIVHGDLKPANCLVFRRPDGAPLAKVTDFGCSKMFLNDTISESYGGTKYWDAPECLEEAPDELKPYAMRTSRDIFSFGMIVIETIFDKHSLRKVGWRRPAGVYEMGKNPPLTTDIDVEEMNVLKLNGGLASMGEELFKARFDFNDVQLHFETHDRDGIDAVRPDGARTLQKFDEIMSAGGECENLKWKDLSVAEGVYTTQQQELNVPLAFCCIRGLLETNPQQRVDSDELRILFKNYRESNPLKRERRGWVPLIVKISLDEHREYQGQMLLRRCLDGSLPTKVIQYMVETTENDIKKYMTEEGDGKENHHLANLLGQLSEFYRLGIWLERDPAASKRYLRLAALKGSTRARRKILVLSTVSDEEVYQLHTVEKVSWALEQMSIALPEAISSKLNDMVLSMKDQAGVAELLLHSISQTMGTVLKYRTKGPPHTSIQNNDTPDQFKELPTSLFEDDHVTFEEVLQSIQDQGGLTAVRKELPNFLHHAGALGMYAVLRFILLHESFDPDCWQVKDALLVCVRKGDVQGLLIFMECGVDVEKLLDDHELHNVSLVGCDMIKHVELILKRRKARGLPKFNQEKASRNINLELPADSYIVGSEIGAILHLTIMANNWNGFCSLIAENDVDLELEDQGKTALQIAIILGRPLFAIILRLMGAQCKKFVEGFGQFCRPTLLHLACRPVRGQELYQGYDLCRLNGDENYTEVDTPISPEVPFQAWKILVQFLLSSGLDLNAQDGDGITPLRYLVRAGGHLARVQFLYELGAILDIPGSNGETVLHTCAYGQEVSLEVVEFIVQNYPPRAIDASWHPSVEGEVSILSDLSRNGKLHICRLLIARGSRLSVRDRLIFDNMSSRLEIMYCPEAGIPSQDEAMANLLQGLREIWVAGNFDPKIHQLSAMHIGNSDQLMILLDCVKPHINSHDIIGRNRLHIAVLENNVEAVRELLSLNINRDKSDWAGLSPLHYAYALSHTGIIKLLEEIPKEEISRAGKKRLNRTITSLFRSFFSYTKRCRFYRWRTGEALTQEVAAPRSMYDQHLESTDSFEAEISVPTPAELRCLCSQHLNLWANYCKSSQSEISRRAMKWPEEVSDKSVDIRSLVEL